MPQIMKKVYLLLTLFSISVFSQKKWGGMTLYTVRNEMGKDPKNTLKQVADLGYKYIEAVDYKDGKFYGMTPDEFKSYLKSLGLQPISVHMGSMTLDNADKLIADAKVEADRILAAAKAAAAKKTITCVKGKLTKKVTAVKPVCPAGYKKK